VRFVRVSYRFNYGSQALSVAAALCADIDDLWPNEHTPANGADLLGEYTDRITDPAFMVQTLDAKKIWEKTKTFLDKKEADRLWGVLAENKTLEHVAKMEKVTRECVRQKVNRTMRKLGHSSAPTYRWGVDYGGNK
jgi:hypothetical protein